MAGKIVQDGITVDDALYFNEQPSAQADIAGKGQLWVKNATPNELWFTDDAGNDAQLGTGGGGGGGYVDRGDPLDHDYDLADFTTDGTWRDLDLSSIVPAGAKAVLFNCCIKDDAVTSTFQLRKNGNSNTRCNAVNRTVVANADHYQDMIVACDSNRVIEYWASNTTWTTISMSVKGWWL